MSRAFRRIAELPRFLQVMATVFGLIPLWSAVTLGPPWDIVQDEPVLAASVLLAAYWVGPLLLCFALLRRSYAVFFVFMVECLALLGHAALDAGDTAATETLARVILVSCVLVLGAAFLYRDVSMPFFAQKRRGWRRASRLRVNSSLRLHPGADRSITVAAEMEDCSLVGMSIAMPVEGGPKLAKGDQVLIIVRIGVHSFEVHGRIEWAVRDEYLMRAGFSTPDLATMDRVIAGTTLRATPRLKTAALKLLARNSVKRAAVMMWIASVSGAAGVPACQSTKSRPSSLKGETVSADVRAEGLAACQQLLSRAQAKLVDFEELVAVFFETRKDGATVDLIGWNEMTGAAIRYACDGNSLRRVGEVASGAELETLTTMKGKLESRIVKKGLGDWHSIPLGTGESAPRVQLLAASGKARRKVEKIMAPLGSVFAVVVSSYAPHDAVQSGAMPTVRAQRRQGDGKNIESNDLDPELVPGLESGALDPVAH